MDEWSRNSETLDSSVVVREWMAADWEDWRLSRVAFRLVRSCLRCLKSGLSDKVTRELLGVVIEG